MKEIIINDNNLTDNEVDVTKLKVRALLSFGNKLLVCNYSGVLMFPGGKLDPNEEVLDALLRELNEETGISYDKDSFKEFLLIDYYQKDYPTREEDVVNRLVKTYYYTGKYNGIDENNMHISKSEIEGNLKLELLSIDDIKDKLKDHVDNPRNDYFVKELNIVIDEYLKG